MGAPSVTGGGGIGRKCERNRGFGGFFCVTGGNFGALCWVEGRRFWKEYGVMYASDSAITRLNRDADGPLLPQILNSLLDWFYVALGRCLCMMTGVYRTISQGALVTGGSAGRGVPGCW